MKIYLDNCCYNRPYDDQTQIRINLETRAKLMIQTQIKAGMLSLVWSYVMDYENSKNPFAEKREAIRLWKELACQDMTESEEILSFAESLRPLGIKTFDALHISCAVAAECDFFLSTDRKLLRTTIPEISIINPIEFVFRQEEESHAE